MEKKYELRINQLDNNIFRIRLINHDCVANKVVFETLDNVIPETDDVIQRYYLVKDINRNLNKGLGNTPAQKKQNKQII